MSSYFDRPATHSQEIEGVEHDLRLAGIIQQSFLPVGILETKGFSIAGHSISVNHIGGDFYDVIRLPDENTLVLIADVMGKGVPAALFAAMLRGMARAFVESSHHPAELLGKLNRALTNELSAVDMFITAQVALLDSNRKRLTVANAGHCPLLVSTGTGDSHALSPKGLPLGIMQGATYAEQTISFVSTSCALLYSDGLSEAENPLGNRFAQDRLELWLAGASGRGTCAREMSRSLLTELAGFQAGATARDDLTFLLISGNNK